MDDETILLLRTQQLAAVHLVCLVVAYITHRRHDNRNQISLPTRDMRLHRQRVRDKMLSSLSTSGKCRELIRMSETAFKTLCQKLENDGGLRPTRRMSVEEQVARFLHIVGNDLRNRFVSWFYRRSRSTTSRHFHRVLSAILSLDDQYLRQPTGDMVPKEIQEHRRFYPFFKDCIGTIDGTHVRVRVPSKDAPRYRGRKYYLVDAGLPHRSLLIAPYRGVRYHLKEYSTRAPQNARELFNLRHASLRNAIERAFGVLKKRFPIIRSTTEPFYSCETQSDIFLACCILHNFLLDEDRDEELEEEVLQEVLNATQEEDTNAPIGIDDRGEQIRNRIANEMWSDYNENNLTMSKKVTDGNTEKRETFNWTPQMDEAFIHAMLKEQDKGNRVDGTFTSQAYNNMVDELSKTLNKPFNKNYLKHRLKTLKDHFSQWYDIFRGVSLSGFAWNSETKLLEADEEVWEALIAEKPEAAKWRKKQISNYDEMLELFGRDRATGAAAETAKERRNRVNTNQEIPETIEEIDRMVVTDEISLENFTAGEDIPITSTMPTSLNPPKATKSKGKKRKMEEEDAVTSKIMVSISDVAAAIRESSQVFERSRRPLYSAEELFNELQLMGVEPDKISSAYLFLVDKPEKTRALFGCPSPMRMSILRDMMGADLLGFYVLFVSTFF
ncbi:hypothetical protein OSB04_031939 [Centaurea solstitialis]|uniref:Transposase n=1 Tax=Centaurea solstitialis TaxID=347529 RepID=A0AA38SNN5_9ASTR|nr:hypothetical protein OSB04_031939 [Centaurea solstitialis]